VEPLDGVRTAGARTGRWARKAATYPDVPPMPLGRSGLRWDLDFDGFKGLATALTFFFHFRTTNINFSVAVVVVVLIILSFFF
jgi:hypothetical protein